MVEDNSEDHKMGWWCTDSVCVEVVHCRELTSLGKQVRGTRFSVLSIYPTILFSVLVVYCLVLYYA